MTDERRKEMELIVELTTTKLDLKFTKEVADLREDIFELIDQRIDTCRQRQEQRRRWTIGTWISIIGPIVAIISAVAAYAR